VRQVAALYVATGGVYFDLPGVDPWDEPRDAKSYGGPAPVVAHPPCGPWGRMAQFCKQDPSCGPRAVEQVRAFGGVLEHPAGSRLFRACGMPHPGERPDEHGGTTVAVEQVSWGHPCRKPTWLYIVGLPLGLRSLQIRTGGTPTHKVRNRTAGNLLQASRGMRSRTPVDFRDWLIDVARSVVAPRDLAP
jgi:hypothetical protein